MTHPLEQLAPYVDGSLTGPERLEVERHLASCAQCRSEVAVASEARAALRSMPEVEVPTDLGGPALEAMGTRETHQGPPRWVRAMPFVAAAAVVALLAITLPRLGGGTAADSAADGALPTAPDTRDLRLEIVSTDFDADSLQAEAQTSAARYAGATSDQEAAPAAADQAGRPRGRSGNRSRAR